MTFHLSTLSSIPANFPSLLQLLAIVIKDTGNSESKQLNLFLIVCSLFRKQIRLDIEPQLYLKMVSFIVEHPEATPVHAAGFLKAAFVNDISLVGCSANALRSFDDKFSSHFDSFYNKLCGQLRLNQRPFLVLPHTCMFLSRPIISYLKDAIEPTAFLPPEMYELFLAVLVYTFTDDQSQADSYLSTLKSKLERWHFVKHSKYENFLACLL